VRKLPSTTSLSIALVIVLAACGLAGTPMTGSVAVLQNYYQALSSNDLDKAMSYVADDAIFIDPRGRYVGMEQIRAAYEGQMNIGGKWEATNIKDTNGKGRLVYDFEGFINDSSVYSGPGLTVVKNGKIIFDGNEFHWKGECDREPSQNFCAD
jgi:hypothetical protein